MKWVKHTSYKHIAKVTASNGMTYEHKHFIHNRPEGKESHYDFALLDQDGEKVHTATGTGNAKEVFGHALSAVHSILHEHTPQTLHFSADQKEPSRVKLYDYMTKRIGRVHPDYVAHYSFDPDSQSKIYHLIHKDHLPRMQQELGEHMPEQLSRPPEPRFSKMTGRPGEGRTASFTTTGGHKYTVAFHPTGGNEWGLQFSNDSVKDNPHGITGTGHAKEVITNVIKALHGHVKDAMPTRIHFQADPSETSRVKLYDFLVAKANKIHPEYHGTKTGNTYSILHESKMPKPEQLAATKRNFLHDLAESYHEKHKERFGLDIHPTDGKFVFDPELGKRTAAVFDKMKHQPDHPFVKKAYGQMKAELLAQYHHLTKAGIKFEPWDQAGQPYKDSKDMQADVLANKRVKYFKTTEGFGSDAKFNDHPLMEEVPHMPGVKFNDLLRGVHDVLAHAKDGHQFGPKGEFQAWGEHARLFSPLARAALTTETHGQNSWVNFGPHGHKPVTERPFADQKAAVLPKSVTPKLQLSGESQGYPWQTWAAGLPKERLEPHLAYLKKKHPGYEFRPHPEPFEPEEIQGRKLTEGNSLEQLSRPVESDLSQQGQARKKLLLKLLLEAKLKPVAFGGSYSLHTSGMDAGSYAEVVHNNEPDAVSYVGHYYGLLNGQGSPDLHVFHQNDTGNHSLTVFDSPLPTDKLYEALAPALQSPMVRVIPKDGFNRVAVVNLQDSGILKASNAANTQQFRGDFSTLRGRGSEGASAREGHRNAIQAYERQYAGSGT